MEAQDALIFIPDISGFTKFVHNTEISHAAHITEEQLELIIDADILGLKVSEIEGDAVLFYRFGPPPTHEELIVQSKKMYESFHKNLKLYESQRVCQCGACSGANDLHLKFIAHYGTLTEKKIKDHTKLFGSDLITAHRLLKNSIAEAEYLLISNSINGSPSLEELTLDVPKKKGTETYEIGPVHFDYLLLNDWRKAIAEPKIVDHSIPGATQKLMDGEIEINAPLDLTFDVLSDLSFRQVWMEPLVDSDKLNGNILKEGSTHRCVIKQDKSDPEFVSHDYSKNDDTITFTESSHSNKIANVFTLTQITADKTLVRGDTFMKPNIIKKFIFDMFMKKKFLKVNDINLQNLKKYCEELYQKGESHSSSIVL